MNILITDKDNNFSELKPVLEKLGYDNIYTVYDTEKTIESARDLRPDLIFLDLNIYYHLKERATSHKKLVFNIPVIYLAVFIKSCINKSLQIPDGAVVLSRPLNLEKVKYSISSVLG